MFVRGRVFSVGIPDAYGTVIPEDVAEKMIADFNKRHTDQSIELMNGYAEWVGEVDGSTNNRIST